MNFSLSHNDCEALEKALIAKRDAAIGHQEWQGFQDAIQLLHDTRMKSFSRRCEKRRRRKPLDLRRTTQVGG